MASLLQTRFPDLSIPKLDLKGGPADIERVQLPGPTQLYCKREDRVGGVYGGNKVRKLEYLLADAKARGVTDLLTLGAVGSHHLVATALYAGPLGLRTHAVLIPQPESDHARDNARLSSHLAASIAAVRSPLAVPLAVVGTWLSIRSQHGRPPLFITAGGSTPIGSLGHVELGLEIARDVAEGRMPKPDRVYVPLGSCGTAAGLLVGLRLAGLDSELVAVRVVERQMSNRFLALRLARRTAAQLPLRPALTGFRVVHDQIGGGYGHLTRAGQQAIETGHQLGLHLEQTYTAKALAGCIGEAERGGTALFVVTANSKPLDDQLAQAPAELPPQLERLLMPPRPV